MSTSHVLMSGIEPRLIAMRAITIPFAVRSRVSHRRYTKRRRKIRKIWLKIDTTWAWTSPQTNEKSGYSLMVFVMVLVPSHDRDGS